MSGSAAAARKWRLNRPVRAAALAGWLAAAGALSGLSACSGAQPIVEATHIAPAMRTALSTAAKRDPDLASFYRARAHRPLWVRGSALRPEARELLELLRQADRHGLDPARYAPARLRAALDDARNGNPRKLARAEALLSRAFADYVLDLRRPVDGARMIATDASIAPPPLTHRMVLDAAARAPALHQHLYAVQQMNPLYAEFRQALAEYRERWSALPQVIVPEGRHLSPGSKGARVGLLRHRLGLAAAGPDGSRFDAPLARTVERFQKAHGLAPTGIADRRTVAALNAGAAHHERLIRANLERARALPAAAGSRFILVDAASATLRLYEGGQVRDTMRVIVGKPDQQTPVMSGVIRFAVLNPYWNLPPDLAQERARHVLREGLGYLRKEKLEALSGWEENARVLSPTEVDWKAVAEGRQKLRMRQIPGPHNVMGDVKFMLPNHLGIYLHDTADKTLFALADRRLSSGCVRVADAKRLSRWLFDGRPVRAGNGTAEERVDLPSPVPVYITYLTAAPAADGMMFRPDVYGRDADLLAQLKARASVAGQGASSAPSVRGSAI